ncbi:MAG: Hpt domain-containing protein [Sphingomicrobium sp.]
MSKSNPSPTPQEILRSRLEMLGERFRTRAADDLGQMRSALARADHQLLRERAHRLSGVAATFGYPEVGEAAKSLDNSINRNALAEEIGANAQRLFELLALASSVPE